LIDRRSANERLQERRFAAVIAATYEMNRDPEKRNDPFTPEDFLPKLEDEEEDDGMPTPEQLEDFKQRMKKSLGIVG